jgi:hypothetical protein
MFMCGVFFFFFCIASTTSTKPPLAATTQVNLSKFPPIVLEFSAKTVTEVINEFNSQPLTVQRQQPLRPTCYLLPVEDVPLPVISIEKVC